MVTLQFLALTFMVRVHAG